MAIVEKYVALLEAKVPSSHIVGCVDNNIFGVNNEVFAETQKHILLLMGIAELTAYPKVSNLADAIHQWACHKLGGVWATMGAWWSKQQAYAIRQMIAKMRKVGHNTTPGLPRVDKTLKPLVELLKTKKKKAQAKSKAMGKSIGSPLLGKGGLRRLHRMASSPLTICSSPKAKKAKVSKNHPANYSQRDLQALFGAPSHSMEEPSDDDEEEEEEDLVSEKAISVADSEGEDRPDVQAAYWNSLKQQHEFILPSGQVVPIQQKGSSMDEEKKDKPEKKLIVKKRPAAQKAWLQQEVISLHMHQRQKDPPTAYIQGKLENHGYKLIVEVAKKNTAQYIAVCEHILDNLKGRMSKGVTVFSELKELGVTLRNDIFSKKTSFTQSRSSSSKTG